LVHTQAVLTDTGNPRHHSPLAADVAHEIGIVGLVELACQQCATARAGKAEHVMRVVVPLRFIDSLVVLRTPRVRPG